MKTILNISFLALLVSLFSCDNSPKKTTTNNPFSENTGDESNDIISFYNKIVKLEDDHAKYIKGVDTYLTNAETLIKKKLENPNAAVHNFSIKPIRMGMTFQTKDIKAPDVLGSKYQNLIKQKEETFGEITTKLDALEVYMKAEDFKDDKGEKFFTFKKELNDLVEKNFSVTEELFDSLEAKVDEAENETLKDHPLRKQIIQSKEALFFTKRITAAAYAETDVETTIKNMEQLYAELEIIAKRNDETPMSTDKNYINKESLYKSINTKVNEYMGQVRLIIRNGKETGQIKPSDLQVLETRGGSVRTVYNSFVN